MTLHMQSDSRDWRKGASMRLYLRLDDAMLIDKYMDGSRRDCCQAQIMSEGHILYEYKYKYRIHGRKVVCTRVCKITLHIQQKMAGSNDLRSRVG